MTVAATALATLRLDDWQRPFGHESLLRLWALRENGGCCLRVIGCDVTLKAKPCLYNEVLYSVDQVVEFIPAPERWSFSASGWGEVTPTLLGFKHMRGKEEVSVFSCVTNS